MLCDELTCTNEKGEVFRGRHLPGRHDKFAVLNFAQSRDVSGDLHVERMIGEYDTSLLAIHQRGKGRFFQSAAAEQPVTVSEKPEVTELANYRAAIRWKIVGGVRRIVWYGGRLVDVGGNLSR